VVAEPRSSNTDQGEITEIGDCALQLHAALDYPPQVRRVMEKYHREWLFQHALH
jgi:hypothetical protein